MQKSRVVVQILVLLVTAFVAGDVGNFNLAFSSSVDPAGIKRSQVCMTNDKFMGSDQTPVLVNGKTYYVCCQGCEESLKNDRSIRISSDPLTGKEVDKADAFIVKKPNGSEEVLYFESSQTYENFLKGHAHHGNGVSLSQSEDNIFTCPMHP